MGMAEAQARRPLAEKGEGLIVVGVDPGRSKCGIAALDTSGGILGRRIADPDDVCDAVRQIAQGKAALVVVGNGTGSRRILTALRNAGFDVEEVDETGTSAMARARYLREHPAKGWRRLIPMGLRYPDEPYDDYVALILAQRRIHT
jgi:hypothetical protein